MPKSYKQLPTSDLKDSRRLPDEAAGLNLPHDFPREVDAVACDLDRTLIGEDAVLRPRTRAALAPLAPPGIHVVVVTGRMFQSVRRYLEAGLNEPVVCYQGAVVAEPVSGRVAAPRADPARARARGDRRASRDAASASTATSTTSCTSPRSRRGAALRDFQDLELHRRRSARLARRPPTKLVVVGDPRRARRTRAAACCERFAGRLYIAKSLPFFLEFAHPDVTKGAGLAVPRRALGFTRERTVAFGDGENDIELVEWAGYGVAVENAHTR